VGSWCSIKVGKTALALNIAENIAIGHNVPTQFVSLDLTRIELAQRMLCSQGSIDADTFCSGFLSKEDRRKLSEARTRFQEAPFFVDDRPNRSLTDIAASARRMRQCENLGLLVVDDLQLILPDDPQDHRQKQLASIACSLKLLACGLKIPILCLSQLPGQPKSSKTNDRPRLRHLRESGVSDRDADVVMFIHNKKSCRRGRDRKREEMAELIVAKQAHGPTGKVLLAWNDRHIRFENQAVCRTFCTGPEMTTRKAIRIEYDDRERFPWLLLAGRFLFGRYRTHEDAERYMARLLRVLDECQSVEW
jgi:replicative DNA helicase